MKRFYKEAAIARVDGGWRVELDGRPVRTAAGNPQILPARALAQALADEWAAQGEELDHAAFRFRDLADYAIDVVAADRASALGSLLAYAETDTLCYRADPDEPLFRRQSEIWEPLLCSVETTYAIRLERVSGVIHRPQPEQSLRRLREILDGHGDFTLAPLATMAALAASLSVALAALEPGADAEGLWAAANLEEDWQAEQWGQDRLAEERRQRRLGDFTDALRFAALARGERAPG